MNNKIMTFEQSFNYAMNTYPSLYQSDDLNLSIYKYSDQIFNVIGNGIRNTKEFIELHTINSINIDLINDFPKKYINGEPLYYGYKKNENITNIYSINEKIPGLFTKDEIEKNDNLQKKYIQSNRKSLEKINIIIPYPNFKKEYSFVWKIDLKKIDVSWILAAKNYYEKSKDFFNSENSHLYYNASPNDEEKMEQAIIDYEKNFAQFKDGNRTKEEFYKAISQAYELEYKGNTKDFIERRWIIEKNRILNFIDETINMLDLILKENNNKKLKM